MKVYYLAILFVLFTGILAKGQESLVKQKMNVNVGLTKTMNPDYVNSKLGLNLDFTYKFLLNKNINIGAGLGLSKWNYSFGIDSAGFEPKWGYTNLDLVIMPEFRTKTGAAFQIGPRLNLVHLYSGIDSRSVRVDPISRMGFNAGVTKYTKSGFNVFCRVRMFFSNISNFRNVTLGVGYEFPTVQKRKAVPQTTAPLLSELEDNQPAKTVESTAQNEKNETSVSTSEVKKNEAKNVDADKPPTTNVEETIATNTQTDNHIPTQRELRKMNKKTLNEILQKLVQAEDYTNAEIIQNEIERRSGTYGEYSYEELEQMKNHAIENEEYLKANDIKQEIE
ncbi:MAG: hypothetical protein C0594_14300, partial [Marinilabiliales bacterium]